MSTSEVDRLLHAQVLKREAVKEQAYRAERERLEAEAQERLGMGGTEMSSKELRKVVDSDRRMYYRTEELNDKLYIHYKGWRELKNLDGWTGLKALYAECNAFAAITGLQNCRQLRSLFLQDNCIGHISGLENCTELWSLNLSGNFIERIEGLENCTKLNTLIISKNKIGFGGLEDLEGLVGSSVCSLDIQDNKIEDPDVLPEVLQQMPDLRVLYLKGNPAAKKIVNYRKTLTANLKELRYIDDRPVFEDDRRCSEAFNRGGIEEERAEKRLIREEKQKKHDDNMKAFQRMIEDSRREKKERESMRSEDKYTDDTDPVEDYEKKMKRRLDAWKEENKADLQDDARIHAEKCLKAEREGKSAPADEADSEADAPQKADACEVRDDGPSTGGDTGADLDEPKLQQADNRKLVYDDIWDDGQREIPDVAAEPEKKKDERKLVYDDIWDDVSSGPPASESMGSKVPAALASALKAKMQEAATSEPFMPWATGGGLCGLDDIAPSSSAVQSRKEVQRSEAAEQSSESQGSWHSKYLEKVTATQAQVQKKAPLIFEPSSRVPAAAAAAAPPPVSESAAEAAGGGELDEMD